MGDAFVFTVELSAIGRSTRRWVAILAVALTWKVRMSSCTLAWSLLLALLSGNAVAADPMTLTVKLTDQSTTLVDGTYQLGEKSRVAISAEGAQPYSVELNLLRFEDGEACFGTEVQVSGQDGSVTYRRGCWKVKVGALQTLDIVGIGKLQIEVSGSASR